MNNTWDNVIYLLSESKTTNNVGDIIKKKPNKKRVYANIKSIGQSEFYQAQATDFKPEVKFILHYFEYENEKTLLYNDKRYSVIRTYTTDEETIELVCSSVIGGK